MTSTRALRAPCSGGLRFAALLLCCGLFSHGLWATSLASPSVFPENAAFFNVGYASSVALNGGVELRLPIDFIDASAGLELAAPLNDVGGSWTVRLSGSGLVFPAFNVSRALPPLALGVGTDLTYSPGDVSAHAGPMVGTDLLFTLDLPITVSAYLAPGFSTADGLSLAWAGQLRYYFDDLADNLALELSSSDLVPVSVGVRFLF